MSPGLPARFIRYLNQLGWLDLLLYGLGRAIERLSKGHCKLYKYRFVAQRVRGAPALSRGRGRQIDVRLCLQAGTLPSGAPRPDAVIARRYARGALSLAALQHGQLAGFLWLQFGAYQEDEVRARYELAAAASAWDFDVWVRPDARLGFTFARLWDEANRLLAARAVDWSCSRISAFNHGSLAAHGAIGTVALGSATFLRCGRWQWMLATRAPYFHLSRNPRSFPRLTFDTSALAPISLRSPHAAS